MCQQLGRLMEDSSESQKENATFQWLCESGQYLLNFQLMQSHRKHLFLVLCLDVHQIITGSDVLLFISFQTEQIRKPSSHHLLFTLWDLKTCLFLESEIFTTQVLKNKMCFFIYAVKWGFLNSTLKLGSEHLCGRKKQNHCKLCLSWWNVTYCVEQQCFRLFLCLNLDLDALNTDVSV